MNIWTTASIIRVIIATIPFVIMSLASSKINLKRSYRGHQFILPIVAIVYCIPVMLMVDHICLAVMKAVGFLAGLASFIPVIGGFTSGWLSTLYASLNLGFGVQLLCNTVIMAAFCVVKRILLPIVEKCWSRWHGLYYLTSGKFYTEKGKGCVLKQKFANMRTMLNMLYITAVVLGAVDCIFALIFNSSSAFQFPFYPVFGIIVLGEISFFLNGYTIDEKSTSHNSDDLEEDEVDYSALQETLKKTFPDRINLTGQFPGAAMNSPKHDWEKELEEGDDLNRVAGTYFSAMQNVGEEINPDYVGATQSLLHKKSVLIYNPFYHDLTEYLLLPIFHELLNHHTCLVICGRMTNEDDIKAWLTEGILNVTNLPKLWKISDLNSLTTENEMPDIGILGFQKLYDLENLKANSKFFKKTTLVILLEPSNLLGTGQIGLRSTLQYCEDDNKKITYCILDRNADGLVDALSHVVRQSITEVIASPSPASPYHRIFWKSEGPGVQTRILPRISHYLGIGGEIASLAMHEGIDNIHWYSGSKMPLLDLRWNVEQYYVPICQYIHSPREQNELDRRFQFHQSLWQANYESKAFVLAEDEFCNVFEMARTFAARVHDKGFINVLSENYMLRDYMCDNEELFTNDPKAIPSIVPDYARTERNFVLRTLMLMAVDSVDESVLSKELSLHGCETREPYHKLCELIQKHTGISEPRIQTIRNDVWIGGRKFSRFAYKVNQSFVDSIFDAALKSAYYVVENEQTDKYPMGNRLLGHVEQVLLPGQFFCYDGKYYQVRSISAESGIIVRRAADHLNSRVYYRQIRSYQMNIIREQEDARDFRGMKIQNCYADINVETAGYLEMKARNLLNSATIVRLDAVRNRSLIHKEILKINMPMAKPEIRFTLCVLLNELFYTIYPSEVGYLTVTMDKLTDCISWNSAYDTVMCALVPKLVVPESESDGIYFIEDSNIDLGLLVSIERNFQRFMEIITDYLDWYLDPNRKEDSVEKPPEDPDKERPLEDESEDDNIGGEDEELFGSVKINYSAWMEYIDYLSYGAEEIPSWLALADTLQFLREYQFDDSNLHRSRIIPPDFDEGSTYDPNQPGVHYCDFCGRPLEKGKYDVLKDGRERCPECSADAVKTRKQFKKVYKETVNEMEQIFGIQLGDSIKVRMSNAKKVNDGFKGTYQPSPRFDPRVLGYAQGDTILVENGAPKWKMKSTLVHELAHIWQNRNWDDSYTRKYASDESVQLSMEGMAVWTEIQYLMSMGEEERAIMYKRNRDADPTIYGEGMKKFLAQYPIRKHKTVNTKKTPFGKFPPL